VATAGLEKTGLSEKHPSIDAFVSFRLFLTSFSHQNPSHCRQPVTLITSTPHDEISSLRIYKQAQANAGLEKTGLSIQLQQRRGLGYKPRLPAAQAPGF